ncbi:MAG: tyrosine-type recombinase/integrase [Thermoflexales bacterium]|nr:tyrosine-type recombinase/integrase [Thermoflexales bacterium]
MDTIKMFVQNCQSQHTAKNAAYRLNAFASWLEAQYHITDLEAVQVRHILAYKTNLASGALQPVSQARALETIRSFFRWCVEVGLLEKSPAEGVKSPRPELNREPAYLETDEMKRLFDLVGQSRHGTRDLAMLWCLATGLRVGEVITLDVKDVVPPNGDGQAWLQVHGKRSYARTIPLPGPAHTAILAHLVDLGDVAGDAPLFPSQWGQRMSRSTVQKWFAGLVESAGLDKSKGHPHAARHGAAMRWVYQSNTPGGIFTVSKMLGHQSLQTTQRYLHLGEQGRRAMVSAIANDPLCAVV